MGDELGRARSLQRSLQPGSARGHPSHEDRSARGHPSHATNEAEGADCGACMVVAFRYVNRELAAVFAVVFFALLVIALGGRFVGYLQEAALGRYSADALWLLAGLRLPEFAQVIAPFALILAMLITCGRLHAEGEFAALTSGGASSPRVLAWLAAGVLAVAGGVACLALVVTPAATRAASELVSQQRSALLLPSIPPGVFHSFDSGRRVTYAEDVDPEGHRLLGVFMSDHLGQDFSTIWAEAGSQYVDDETGSRFLLLERGARYEGTAGDAAFDMVEFERLGRRIESNTGDGSPTRAGTLPLRRLDPANAAHVAELQWRFSLPLLTVVGAFAAFGLARVRQRAGRFARIVPGTVLFAAYFLCCAAARGAVADGTLPAAVGVWPVHAAMLLLALYCIRRSARPI